jgi:hypothetical protein
MSKTKNKSQSGKPYRLNDAVLQYHAKNYLGAWTRLCAANLRPEEAQKAKRLEYILQLRLSFQALQVSDYRKTITTVQSLSETDALASALTGIAHLYLLQYDTAVPFLEKAAKQYPVFSAYTLLAQLHCSEFIDFQDFINKYSKDWTNCSEQQKQYIQIVYHATNEQKEAAIQLANAVKTESHFQHLNWEALKVLLADSAYAQSVNEKVKPWYRALLLGALKDFERDYLKSFGELTQEALTVSSPTQKPLSSVLQKALNDQYKEQKVLDDAMLYSLLEAVLKEQRPYIIYNQIANLYNNRDLKGLKTAKYVFTKYVNDFAAVPESLNLMVLLYESSEFNANANNFWQFTKSWMNFHKATLSVEQADALAWHLMHLWVEYPDLCEYYGLDAYVTGITYCFCIQIGLDGGHRKSTKL